MAKSSYLSNSAKLLIVACAVLLVANSLLITGSLADNQSLTQSGSSLSNKALYIVLIIGFIAFNGEGICYKRQRDRKSKKITSRFKIYLLICFIMNYIKGAFDTYATALNGIGRTVACFIMSIASTVFTYGFLLCIASLWYIFRDKSHKRLLPFEASAFIFGLVYNAYKLFYYVVEYEIIAPGSMLATVFGSNGALRIINILHLIFSIIMLVRVARYYGRLGEKEQAEMDKKARSLNPARNVYKDEGFGIDTMEDDFLISETIEE